MVLVPRDTPGLTVVRPMTVFGYDDHEHGGHAELRFEDVRVPAANLVGDEGRASRSPRPGSAPAGSTTACARSGSPSGRSS